MIRHEAGREEFDARGSPLLEYGCPDGVCHAVGELCNVWMRSEREMEDSFRVGVRLTVRELGVLGVPHRRMLADRPSDAAPNMATQ